MRKYCLLWLACLLCLVGKAQTPLFIIEQNGKKGLRTPDTNEDIVPCQFSFLQRAPDGSFLACTPADEGSSLPNLTVYYDARGKEMMRFENTYRYEPLSEGFARFSTGTHYGYINRQGKMIAKPTFAIAHDFHEGVAVVKESREEGHFSLINTEGRKVVLLPKEYSFVSSFSEGVAFVVEGGAVEWAAFGDVMLGRDAEYETPWGNIKMIDKQGKVLADFSSNSLIRVAYGFKNGLAKVGKPQNNAEGHESKDELFGVIDRQGKIIVPIEYKQITIEPSGDISAVRASGETLLFDRQGKALLNAGEVKPYYAISPPFGAGGRFRLVQENSQEQGWGVIDTQNAYKLIVPMQYKSIFFRAPSDFWAVEKWENLQRQYEQDGGTVIQNYGKAGKVTFYTYNKPLPTEHTMQVFDARVSRNAFSLKGKWGVLEGDNILFLGYDSLRYTEVEALAMGELLAVEKKGRWGYVNAQGEEAIMPQYALAQTFHGGIAAVKKGKYWGFIRPNNRPVTAFEFDSLESQPIDVFRGVLYRLGQKKGFWGLLDGAGKEVVPFQYQKIDAISPNFFIGKDKNGKVGISNYAGKALIPYEYDALTPVPHFDGYFLAQKAGKQGIITLENKEIVPVRFGSVQWIPNQNKIWLVREDNLMGAMREGDAVLLLPTEFEEIIIEDKHFKTKKRGKWGLMDMERNVILPNEYDEIGKDGGVWGFGRESNFLVCKKNGLYGVINVAGKVVLSPLYDDIHPYAYPFIVQKGKKYGMVGEMDKIVLPVEFDSLSLSYTEAETVVRARKAGKEGFYRKSGELLVPLEYDELGHFRVAKGLFVGAKKKGRWGYLNEKSKFVIPAVYEDACIFEKIAGKPLAIVKKKGKWGVIDAKNKTIIPFAYDALRWEEFEQGKLYTEQGERKVYIDLTGKEVK